MRLELKTGQTMKKIFLLPFCISCVCGISACSTQSYEQDEIFIADEEVTSIDMTNNSGARCGVNGISCNDTALVNYTKTEADYREYGERTRRDHLYTQASAGNNLTASIRPAVEDDVVVAMPIARPVQSQKPRTNDGVFQKTASTDVGAQPQAYNSVPVASRENLGINNNIRPNAKNHVDNRPLVSDESTSIVPASVSGKQPASTKYSYEVVCGGNGCTNQPRYNTVCDGECEDIVNVDNNIITSEFTEESFDIADYIEPEMDTDEIAFNDVGTTQESITDINIDEVKISDNTILTWEAEEGDNLRDLLTKWSAMSGWKLLWQTNRNYVLSAGVMFKGKFADVSSALVRAFARARPAPIATYYKGNRVIVIETMENENAY